MPIKKSWFNVVNKKTDKENRVIVNIHGYIGMWDITANDLISQVNGIDDIDVLETHINSYGGEVFEGVAIYNWLRNHKAKVETVIDSVAASIASVIFCAGEKRTIFDTSMAMVHLPISFSYGNSKQMRKDADALDKIDAGTIRKAYRKTVGNKLDDKEIDELMQNEEWLDSEELIEYGFATDKIEDKSTEEEINDKLQKAAYGVDDFKKFGLAYNSLPKKVFNIFVPKNNSAPVVDAGKPNKEGNMPIENKNNPQADTGAQPVVDIEKIAAEAADKERKRIENIRATAESMGVSGEVVKNLIDSKKPLDEAITELIAAKNLAAAQPQNPAPVPTVDIVVDDADNFRKGATNALCMAAGIPIDSKELENVRKSDMPKSIHALLRRTLARAGMKEGIVMDMSPSDLARNSIRVARNAASVGTGDLTNVLADTINKSIGIGYTGAPTTWQRWGKVVPVNDFKNYSVVKISTFGDMDTIPEGAAFKKGALSDKKEQGAVTVKGKSLTVSMQTLVNDDLNGLTRMPSLMGAAHSWSQNKAFYDYLFGSAAVGPTLLEADSNGGYSAFTSYRGNFATGAGAPSVSTLSTARTAMRNQTALKGEAGDTAQRLNLVPSYIITGTTLETTVEQLLMSKGVQVSIDPAQSISDVYNPFAQGGRTALEIVIDAYLDSLSTTVWYLAASQSLTESMVMLALEGQIMPTVRSEDSRVGEALGINYDVYGAWAPMMVDFRGMYCHKGA